MLKKDGFFENIFYFELFQMKGWFTLREDITDEIINSLELNKNKGESLWFIRGKWQMEGLGNMYPYVKQWLVEELCAFRNDQPSILKNIQEISFPNLKVLSIGYNGIASLEGINRIEFPALLRLFLRNNEIRSVASFRKANFPALSFLAFDENYFVDGQKLTQMSCSIKALDLDDAMEENWQFSDISWLGKIPFKLDSLIMKNVSRINQKRVNSRLSQKHDNLVITLQ